MMTSEKTFKKNVEDENVVLIDEDNPNAEISKNLEKKSRRATRLKSDKIFPVKTYIYIDDDDEIPISNHSQKNVSHVKLSMRKRTYPSFSIQSDSDDSEFMVDSSGTLQEQWTHASLKRKTNVETDNCEETRSAVNEVVLTSSDIVGVTVEGSIVNEREKVKETNVETDNCEETPSAVNEVVLMSSDMDGVTVEESIINEREMVKETDEFKRAVEEELLARQRALKVQAEEAQQERRLLKRKKAEKLRLLEIENRQKQRVEEIRESQKQDEENMNLKEIYRTEVQQKLKMLEMRCYDMASLLRGLGILVDNNPYVSSIQVHAAYKRALLSFHPDRASGFDMRQQVEAEEKFKLISRMKEKVCNTPTLK